MEGAREEDLGWATTDFRSGARALSTETDTEDADESARSEIGSKAGPIEDGGSEKAGFEGAGFPLEAGASNTERAGILAFELEASSDQAEVGEGSAVATGGGEFELVDGLCAVAGAEVGEIAAALNGEGGPADAGGTGDRDVGGFGDDEEAGVGGGPRFQADESDDASFISDVASLEAVLVIREVGSTEGWAGIHDLDVAFGGDASGDDGVGGPAIEGEADEDGAGGDGIAEDLFGSGEGQSFEAAGDEATEAPEISHAVFEKAVANLDGLGVEDAEVFQIGVEGSGGGGGAGGGDFAAILMILYDSGGGGDEGVTGIGDAREGGEATAGGASLEGDDLAERFGGDEGDAFGGGKS